MWGSRRTTMAMATAVLAASLLAGAAAGSTTAASGPTETGTLYVVQAVPGETYRVSVDDDGIDDVRLGRVLGPFDLAPGSHDVDLDAESGGRSTMTVEVRAGTVTDLVVHEPASPGGDPVVTTYLMPTGPLGADEARVLVAHTATVAPADVRVDGKAVFTNIANGEHAVAEVPRGTHQVALFATGTTKDPLLGPVGVSLPGATLTAAFAYGNPERGSMNVITQQLPVPTRAAGPPRRIETGDAGLVVRIGPAFAGG